jgi:LysR family glycine cleavage system transcriptional activator
VAAAEEPGISAAAVSQKVRHLESDPGKVLFSRFNNRSALTDADQAVFAGTIHALDEISTFTARLMSGPQRSTLVVCVLPSLAECWFMERFAAFSQLEPQIKIY